jgi:hypothetical protein
MIHPLCRNIHTTFLDAHSDTSIMPKYTQHPPLLPFNEGKYKHVMI